MAAAGADSEDSAAQRQMEQPPRRALPAVDSPVQQQAPRPAGNAVEQAAEDSADKVCPPTAFPTRRFSISARVSEMDCLYNHGRPTSLKSAWPTTAKTIPTRTACRWASCNSTCTRSREKSSRLPDWSLLFTRLTMAFGRYSRMDGPRP